MAADTTRDRGAVLTRAERGVAFAVGLLLLGASAWAILDPPDRVVAISGCTPSAVGDCTAATDADLTTLATTLALLGVIVLLVALLGLRFSKISAAGVTLERNWERVTAGLEPVPASADSVHDRSAGSAVPSSADSGDGAPVPEFERLGAEQLNRRRDAIYKEHRQIFLGHLLAPASSSSQKYQVAIFVVGHKYPITPETVEGATLFLGEKWGSRKLEAAWTDEGRLGVVVEAYGPFLALAEVRLRTGGPVTLSHYVDFSQGALLR